MPEKTASDVSPSTLNPLKDLSHSTPSSVSKGLSETTKVSSALSEFLYHPERDSSSKKATTSTARVLTSEESLCWWKRKRRNETWKKQKRNKKEREDKTKEREAEKERKAEERKRKKEEQERRKNVKQTQKHSNNDPPESPIDGVQTKEIRNDECAVCFGLYEDDLSPTGKLEKDWLQCTNDECMKWMHAECLEQDEDDLFMCTHCGTFFA